ncbi:kinesin-like protein KIN-4C [Senna tora]|uniref:Kinesin-like protein KIN-4C n=1 Tax=Senna tora TaxID=362788 RepID=A0A834SRA7_9FABA|nr:kinesin-like protein KIN-4C [Senna tora]
MEFFVWILGFLKKDKKLSISSMEIILIASFTCGNEYSSDSDAKAVDVSDGIEDHAKELEHSSLQEKWDLDAVEELPQYMMICYMALYNPTNEIAYRVQRNMA